MKSRPPRALRPATRRRLLSLAAGLPLWPGLAVPATSVAPRPAPSPPSPAPGPNAGAGVDTTATAATPVTGSYPDILPGLTLEFPRDHGAHPAFRIEWWYITGWLQEGARELGFQITFFRHRPRVAEGNPSRFAPHQLLFAHAALAEAGDLPFLHDQRAARAGFGHALAASGDADVRLDRWRLWRDPGSDRWQAVIPTRDFSLTLTFTPAGAPLRQGVGGYSRKGPQPRQASGYYSLPQLQVSGQISRRLARAGPAAAPRAVTGRAWLDHEWSSSVLDPAAAGWDWVGLNFADGSALMAFRIRRRDGGALWAGGSLLQADGRSVTLTPGEIAFETLRSWRSPATGATWPVAQVLRVGARRWRLEPLRDDQELDSRASSGVVYWEGAVRVFEIGPAGTSAGAAPGVPAAQPVGHGYLELTGYHEALRL